MKNLFEAGKLLLLDMASTFCDGVVGPLCAECVEKVLFA
jgi:hypothetical protein